MKKVLLLMVAFLMSVSAIIAQSHTISGVVLDDQNDPLPGASVIVKGTEGSPVGTITSIDGSFSLEMPDGHPILIVSFIGFDNQEVDVSGKQNVSIQMKSDTENLEEVVVTALGIKREKKALGYAVQNVAYDEVKQSGSISPLESLSGQVSGLSVAGSSGGQGGSTRFMIRGANSLTGSNEPLFVIDGVPIDNSGGASVSEFGGSDYGNAANNINPDDIESVSVLKGGAAAALYGSRGQNGVIMITTKSGANKERVEVQFSTGVTYQTPVITPDFQNVYSQGSGGRYVSDTHLSWGEKMNGTNTVTNFLGEEQLLTRNNENPVKDFFHTSTSYVNSLSISKSYEKTNLYFSATNNSNDNIMPNSDFDKTSLNMRVSSELTPVLKVDAKVNFINQNAFNRPNLGGSPDNPVYSLVRMPRSVTNGQMDNYSTVNGYPVIYTNSYRKTDDAIAWNGTGDYPFASSPLLNNHYWAVNRNTNEDTRNRVISFFEATLDLKELFEIGLDKLTLKGRAGIDMYDDDRRRITYDKTNYKTSGLASIYVRDALVQENNYQAMLSGLKYFNNVSISASLGANLRQNKWKSITSSSNSGIINESAGYYLNNFNSPSTNEGLTEKEMQSVFGLLTFDWKQRVYLDLTARNDWSSALSEENRSFFYPSGSLSLILNEILTLPASFDLLKLRASAAQVGNDLNPGQLNLLYTTSANQYMGLPYGGIGTTVKLNPNILPEKTNSYEVGIEGRMFQDKLNYDVALYQTSTTNQIFDAPISPSSGFEKGKINAGEVKNNGVELSINYHIVNNGRFSWRMGANFTKSWSEVVELREGVDKLNFYQDNDEKLKVQARLGERVGQLVGSAYNRDSEGRLILDDNNLPTWKTNEQGAIDTEVVLGNVMPDIEWGISNTFKLYGFDLSVFINSKMGHQMYSNTNSVGSEMGTLDNTIKGRDEWASAMEQAGGNANETRKIGGLEVQGVKNGFPGTFYANPQQYWERLNRNIREAFVYDASYIRLSKINLGYNIKKTWLENTPISSLRLSLFANNIAYLYKETPNVSPESSVITGSGYGGVEIYAFPETTSYGFNLNVSF
jgi:TonB-linked SusC/RagA family outer membrane protein